MSQQEEILVWIGLAIVIIFAILFIGLVVYVFLMHRRETFQMRHWEERYRRRT